MRDTSSTGTADESALLAGSKKLDDLRNALESNKETSQVDAMKKVIGYIAKGKILYKRLSQEKKIHHIYNVV